MTLSNQIIEVLNKEAGENVSIELYSSEKQMYTSIQFNLRQSKQVVSTYDFAAVTANSYRDMKEVEAHLQHLNTEGWNSYEINSVDKIVY